MKCLSCLLRYRYAGTVTWRRSLHTGSSSDTAEIAHLRHWLTTFEYASLPSGLLPLFFAPDIHQKKKKGKEKMMMLRWSFIPCCVYVLCSGVQSFSVAADIARLRSGWPACEQNQYKSRNQPHFIAVARLLAAPLAATTDGVNLLSSFGENHSCHGQPGAIAEGEHRRLSAKTRDAASRGRATSAPAGGAIPCSKSQSGSSAKAGPFRTQSRKSTSKSEESAASIETIVHHLMQYFFFDKSNPLVIAVHFISSAFSIQKTFPSSGGGPFSIARKA